MPWTPKVAHLLLQTRTKVLDGDLEGVFRSGIRSFDPSLPPPRTFNGLPSRTNRRLPLESIPR